MLFFGLQGILYLFFWEIGSKRICFSYSSIQRMASRELPLSLFNSLVMTIEHRKENTRREQTTFKKRPREEEKRETQNKKSRRKERVRKAEGRRIR